MDVPLSLGKRMGAQLERSPKVARNIYGQPSLEGIPDDITKIILMYVISANSNKPQEKINFTVKGSHACPRVNKKFYRLSNQALKDLCGVLSTQHPDHFLEALNEACINPKRMPFLKRFVESSPGIVFSLTPRITPLMVAVGYNNENAVDFLLQGAKERGICKPFVDLHCDTEGNNTLGLLEDDLTPKYTFDCQAQFTALHIAASAENKVSVAIFKKVLAAGASPDLFDANGSTALSWALADNSNAEAKVALLMEYNADPHADASEWFGSPYETVQEEIQTEDPMPSYVLFGKLFAARQNKLL